MQTTATFSVLLWSAIACRHLQQLQAVLALQTAPRLAEAQVLLIRSLLPSLRAVQRVRALQGKPKQQWAECYRAMLG